MKSMTLLRVKHGSSNTTWYSQCIAQVKLTWVTVHIPCHTSWLCTEYTMWCYRSHAHAIMSLISFVFSLLLPTYKRNTGSFNLLTFSFHNFRTFLFKVQYCIVQSAHYINTAFFSISSQPYSPNRVISCTSRHPSELLRFTELVEEFQMFKTDN